MELDMDMEMKNCRDQIRSDQKLLTSPILVPNNKE